MADLDTRDKLWHIVEASPLCLAEVVEYSCNIAPDMMGEYVEGVAAGMDTYSLKQPLGVRRHA